MKGRCWIKPVEPWCGVRSIMVVSEAYRAVDRALGRIQEAFGPGNVIVVSSIGADLCAPFGAPYYVAKAGANALVKVLAKELAPAKKRVNCIAPGMIATDMGNKLVAALGEGIVSTIPLGRYGSEEEIANVIRFLCSPEASYVTGQVIHVNGGLWM